MKKREFIPERDREPYKLPVVITQETNPVEKYVALIESLCKKQVNNALNGHPANLREGLTKILMQHREESIAIGIAQTNKLYQHLNE